MFKLSNKLKIRDMKNEIVAERYRENVAKENEFVGKVFDTWKEADNIAINKAFAHGRDYGFRVVNFMNKFLVIGRKRIAGTRAKYSSLYQ